MTRWPDLLKIPKRHNGQVEMSQQRVTHGLDLLQTRFRRRQLRLQLTHARDARVSYDVICCHRFIRFQLLDVSF